LAVERIRRLPVLLLITFRPEFEPPWTGLPNVGTLTLGRLDRQHAQTMAEQASGNRSLPQETTEQIIVRSDGIPLFVEELTKALLETGNLIAEAKDHRLDGTLPPIGVPATLHDSLMARLDRLAGAKEIAQTAAAIGREFSYSLLSSVAGQNGNALEAPLTQLEQAQLVFRKGTPPESAYMFKHALVQDIAYESLTKSRRMALHQRIAETIREHFPAIAETQPEVVAHHFTQARLTEQAVEWWGKAGAFALHRPAFIEAIAHLEKALHLAEQLNDDPPRRLLRLSLQLNFGHALTAARGYGARETAAAFERVRELAIRVEDFDAKFAADWGLWVHAYVRGESRTMLEQADIFRRHRDGMEEPPETGVGGLICGQTDWFHGDFIGARREFERTLTAYRSKPEHYIELRITGGHDAVVAAKNFLASILWALGDTTRAGVLADEAISRALAGRHTTTIANMYAHRWVFEMIRRQPAEAHRAAQAMMSFSQEHGLSFFLAHGRFMLAYARWHQGEPEAGMSEMREGMAEIRNQDLYAHVPLMEMLMAEAEAKMGRIDAAIAMIDEQLTKMERTGQRWVEAETYRVRGQMLLDRQPSDHAAAEDCFRRAIEIARAQQTKSFELRATLALAKLYHATGRDKMVPELLAPALAYFNKEVALPELDEGYRLLDSITGS